ncbi:MAG: stage II sporulation protein P [Acutalibacteraceae bacterium]|nr:stage II sporulation protein P [Acutalibacteraceae bacterium]
MREKNGILGLIITSALCVCIVAFGAFYITGEDFITASNGNEIVNEYTVNTPTQPDEITNSGSSEQSVTAGTSGTVLGKVTQSFITPYKSNTSYNRVYINNKTDVPINLEQLLKDKNPVDIEKNDEPQVLIMHTHATECYLSANKEFYTDTDLSRTTDNSKNMIAIGKVFADTLNSAGIKTLQDTTAHDYPAYNGSYTRSKETVEKYLKQYPSIKVVIDVHRDSINASDGTKTKPVIEIDGKNAAQIMLVMGCGAKISGYENWTKNLTFATHYQQTLEVLYPGLARSIRLVNSRYNQNLTTGSILIEVGTDSNSLEEALYGAKLASKALVSYLNTL